jgi:hypothetical protein
MAHFYGAIQGGRGRTTRAGTKNSGLEAMVRGWKNGGDVEIRHENGKDVVYFYATRGSAVSGGSLRDPGRKLVAKLHEDGMLESL